MNRGRQLIVLASVVLLPVAAIAQPVLSPYSCRAYLDTDGNAATGGTVQVIQAGDATPQDRNGVDVIVSALAQMPPAHEWGPAIPGMVVVNVTVERWNPATPGFEQVGSYDVSYPIGWGTGLDGHNVIEFTAPLAAIGPLAPTIRMLYHISLAAFNDYTSTFTYAQQAGSGIPTVGTLGVVVLGLLLGAAGLLVLRRSRVVGVAAVVVGCIAALSGLAWALTITPDGQVGDWAGSPPAVTDPIGDSSAGDANEDIVYGFVTSDATTMGFRVDVLNVDVSDPYASPTTTPTLTPPATTPTATPPGATPTVPPPT